MSVRQMAKNIVGPDLAARVDRQQLSRFDPEDSQGVYRQPPSYRAHEGRGDLSGLMTTWFGVRSPCRRPNTLAFLMIPVSGTEGAECVQLARELYWRDSRSGENGPFAVAVCSPVLKFFCTL